MSCVMILGQIVAKFYTDKFCILCIMTYQRNVIRCEWRVEEYHLFYQIHLHLASAKDKSCVIPQFIV